VRIVVSKYPGWLIRCGSCKRCYAFEEQDHLRWNEGRSVISCKTCEAEDQQPIPVEDE
jgi:hypothetical protein